MYRLRNKVLQIATFVAAFAFAVQHIFNHGP